MKPNRAAATTIIGPALHGRDRVNLIADPVWLAALARRLSLHLPAR
jgi:hypothetical protein